MNASEQSLENAEQQSSRECVAMSQKLREADAPQIIEVRDHPHGMSTQPSGR